MGGRVGGREGGRKEGRKEGRERERKKMNKIEIFKFIFFEPLIVNGTFGVHIKFAKTIYFLRDACGRRKKMNKSEIFKFAFFELV